MRRLIALALCFACPASAAPIRLAPAGQLRLPGITGFGINPALATSGLGGLDLPLSAVPTLEFGLLPMPEAGAHQAALSEAPARNLNERPVISFFLNDHNASRTYRKELETFVSRHEELMVEMLKPGKETQIFQAVADGTKTPAQARKELTERREPMDIEILRAIYRTGIKILPEPIHERPYRAVRARIDNELIPAAGNGLNTGFDSFIEDGDMDSTFDSIKDFNEKMVEVHRLREEALVESLQKRANRVRKKSVGVLYGMFHTQPYHALKRAGVDTEREYHPKARGPIRMMPYNRPLRRIRFGKPYTDADAEKRDTLAMILFFGILDPVFRIDKFADVQTPLYNRIADKMSVADYEALGEALAEEGFDSHDEVSWFTLQWLQDHGMIDTWERMTFRMDPATHQRLAKAGKKAFFRIAKLWKLSEEEQRGVLGVSSSARLKKLKDDPDAILTEAELERVSYTLGIYKAIHTIFSNKTNVRHWLKAANKHFDGDTALSRMMSGTKGAADVRSYLDAWAFGGGW